LTHHYIKIVIGNELQFGLAAIFVQRRIHRADHLRPTILRQPKLFRLNMRGERISRRAGPDAKPCMLLRFGQAKPNDDKIACLHRLRSAQICAH